MAMHTIDRVREAELKANADREAAEAEAQSIIDRAQRESESIIAQAQEAAASMMCAVTKAASEKSEELVAERRRAALEEAEALKEKTVSLKQNVINKLIEESLA